MQLISTLVLTGALLNAQSAETEKPITLTMRGTRMVNVAKILEPHFGAPVTVAPVLAETPIFIRVKEMPPNQLRKSIEQVVGGTWRKEDGRWILGYGPQNLQQELASEAAWLDEWYRNCFERKGAIEEVAAPTVESILTDWRGLKKESSKGELKRLVEDGYPYFCSVGTVILLNDIIKQLPRRQLLALPGRNKRIVFSETPTKLQLPLPNARGILSSFQNVRQRTNEASMAFWSMLSKEDKLLFKRPVSSFPNDCKLLLILSSKSYPDMGVTCTLKVRGPAGSNFSEEASCSLKTSRLQEPPTERVPNDQQEEPDEVSPGVVGAQFPLDLTKFTQTEIAAWALYDTNRTLRYKVLDNETLDQILTPCTFDITYWVESQCLIEERPNGNLVANLSHIEFPGSISLEPGQPPSLVVLKPLPGGVQIGPALALFSRQGTPSRTAFDEVVSLSRRGWPERQEDIWRMSPGFRLFRKLIGTYEQTIITSIMMGIDV